MKIEQWPQELDALIAAPEHHTLLYENERVRVLDTLIRPGDKTPVHTHQNPSVFYVLSWSDFIRYDGAGNEMVDSRESSDPPPQVIWAEPLGPHSVENVGKADLHVYSVEVKQASNPR